MYITDKFVASVWKNETETDLLKDGIVNYFLSKNQKIYYKIINPFHCLDLDVQAMKRDFIFNFENDILSNDLNQLRYAYAVKYLSEQLLEKSVTAPLVLLFKDNSYILTKGNKKIYALALANIFLHPAIIVSETKVEDSTEIKNDDALYSILQHIDNNAFKFYVRIDFFDNCPAFHFLEDYSKPYVWVNENECHKLYQNNKIKFPIKVLISDNITANNNLLDLKKFNKKITSFKELESIDLQDYFAVVLSKNKINLDLRYLDFIHFNVFKKSKLQLGYTNSYDDFSSNEIIVRFNQDGIINQIPFLGF